MTDNQVPAKLTNNEPDKTIVVNDGTEVHAGQGDDRKVVRGGETVTLAGPEADDLVLAGYATYAE